MTHPNEFAIGSTVTMTRRIGRSVVWRAEGEVVRHTATLIIVKDSRHGNEVRFRQRPGGRYEMSPAYLDYITTCESRQTDE